MILLQKGNPVLRFTNLTTGSAETDIELTAMISRDGIKYDYQFVYAFQQEILNYSNVIIVNGVQIPTKEIKQALLGFWLLFEIDYSILWETELRDLGIVLDKILTNNYKITLFPRKSDNRTYFEIVPDFKDISIRDLRHWIDSASDKDGNPHGHYEGFKLNFKSAQILREINWEIVNKQSPEGGTTGEPQPVIGGQIST